MKRPLFWAGVLFVIAWIVALTGCGPRARRDIPMSEWRSNVEAMSCGVDRQCTLIHTQGEASTDAVADAIGCGPVYFCGIADVNTIVIYAKK